MTLHTPDPASRHTRQLHSGLYVPDDLMESTAPLDVVDSDTASAPVQPADPIPEPPRPAPAPAPHRAPAEAPTPTPDPAPAPTPAPDPAAELEAPPELVVPPEPTPHLDTMIVRWSSLFPKLVWLSVIAGLAGQIFGWSKVFGGGPVAIGVAVTLGGTFEFIMVSASSRGLRDIGRCRPWWQVLLFLALGTACAAVAFWMNLDHFTGDLAMVGVAAAGATAVGYIAHCLVHLFDELDNRAAYQQWQRERDRIQAEIDERNRRLREAHDQLRDAELEARTASARATQVQPAPAEPTTEEPTEASAPAPAPVKAAPARASKPKPPKPTPPKRGSTDDNKPTRDVAVPLGVQHNATTPAELKRVLDAAGYEPASRSGLQIWCREIRAQLQ